MLKFNDFPPKEIGDVEFSEVFIKTHRAFDPLKMGRLVAHTLLENMQPENRHNAPEIMANLIDTFPEHDSSSGIIYSSLFGRMIPHNLFVSSIEVELGQNLPEGVKS